MLEPVRMRRQPLAPASRRRRAPAAPSVFDEGRHAVVVFGANVIRALWIPETK